MVVVYRYLLHFLNGIAAKFHNFKPTHNQPQTSNTAAYCSAATFLHNWYSLRFYDPLDTKQVIWETFPSLGLAWKNNTWHNKSTHSPIKINIQQHKNQSQV